MALTDLLNMCTIQGIPPFIQSKDNTSRTCVLAQEGGNSSTIITQNV